MPDKHVTKFDLLNCYRSIYLTFKDFLAMLLAMRIRLYSIASSALADPSVVSITYSVHANEPTGPGLITRYVGVCTSYLSYLKPGYKVQASIKSGKIDFKAPSLNKQMQQPMIMIAAGAGTAPFRGFIQERHGHVKLQRGLKLAPAVLYMGCRSPDDDRLYANELEQWTARGVAEVKHAFSREPLKSAGCKHVTDLLVMDAAAAGELWEKGARIYICGSSKFSQDVKRALKDLARMTMEQQGLSVDDDALKQRLQRVTQDRLVADVSA